MSINNHPHLVEIVPNIAESCPSWFASARCWPELVQISPSVLDTWSWMAVVPSFGLVPGNGTVLGDALAARGGGIGEQRRHIFAVRVAATRDHQPNLTRIRDPHFLDDKADLSGLSVAG